MDFKSNTTSDWATACGTRLEGGYIVGELVSADGAAALFRAISPDDHAPPGLAKLFRLDASAAARQREVWQALGRINHANLLRISTSGEMESGGELVTYVVTEGADESLATVLAERSLTAEEAGGVLLSLVPALKQLHEAGFVQGRVCPAEIFSVGDTIKLSTDCAVRRGEKPIANYGPRTYLAPEQQNENTTRAADVWCVGASLFEALTQLRWAEAVSGDAAKLPAPFDVIVARCVDPQPGARPGMAEILSLYEAGGVPKADTNRPQTERTVEYATADTTGKRFDVRKRVLLPLLAALVLLVVVFSLWRQKNNTAHSAAAVTSPDAKQMTRQPVPASAPPARPEPTAPPQPTLSVATKEPESVAKKEPEARTTVDRMWHVVLWTYGKREDAQKQVDHLTTTYPDLRFEVYTPDTSNLNLVVMGGEMTRSEAEETQQKARQIGLPRDTYIQSFRR